jgi:hypothetical protein
VERDSPAYKTFIEEATDIKNELNKEALDANFKE